MTRNVTLRLDEGVLKQARLRAVEQDRSLSQWVADLIAEAVADGRRVRAARRRSLKALDTTFDLGGKPLSRDEVHERRTGLR